MLCVSNEVGLKWKYNTYNIDKQRSWEENQTCYIVSNTTNVPKLCKLVWGRECNFFDDSQVRVLDLKKKSTTSMGLWKSKISNNRSGPSFKNVFKQRVRGRYGGIMHLKVGIQSRIFIKNLAQYSIEFLKLFWFIDKNPHNHSWFLPNY